MYAHIHIDLPKYARTCTWYVYIDVLKYERTYRIQIDVPQHAGTIYTHMDIPKYACAYTDKLHVVSDMSIVQTESLMHTVRAKNSLMWFVMGCMGRRMAGV